MRRVALIVAGGKGMRMNQPIPKQFLLIKGLPILMHTIKKFSHLDEIYLVLPETQFKYWENLCIIHKFNHNYSLIAGGKTRFDSVKKGLRKIDENSIVAIHDGVRPLISTSLIDKLCNATKEGIGVIPIIKVKDSIRKIEEKKLISICRKNLYKVQTPQCFLSSEIKTAYNQNTAQNFTDDASVFESNNGVINSILGDEKNLKITTEEDLLIAESII